MIPISNLVFVRSRRESDLGNQLEILADGCWPFYGAAIAELKPRVILCFGGRDGEIHAWPDSGERVAF
jgi:hypothetical protein